MTNPAEATPTAAYRNPALALPGFTKEVTLETGITVHIRKVDTDAVALELTRSIMGDYDASPSDLNPRQQLELAVQVRRQLLLESLVQPPLEELTAMYGGRPDSADFGLGPDLNKLLTAVDEWSGGEAAKLTTAPLAAAPVPKKGRGRK